MPQSCITKTRTTGKRPQPTCGMVVKPPVGQVRQCTTWATVGTASMLATTKTSFSTVVRTQTKLVIYRFPKMCQPPLTSMANGKPWPTSSITLGTGTAIGARNHSPTMAMVSTAWLGNGATLDVTFYVTLMALLWEPHIGLKRKISHWRTTHKRAMNVRSHSIPPTNPSLSQKENRCHTKKSTSLVAWMWTNGITQKNMWKWSVTKAFTPTISLTTARTLYGHSAR